MGVNHAKQLNKDGARQSLREDVRQHQGACYVNTLAPAAGGPEERIMAGLSRNVGFSQVDCRCMMSLDCQGCRITDTQSKYAVLIVENHPARPGANEV